MQLVIPRDESCILRMGFVVQLLCCNALEFIPFVRILGASLARVKINHEVEEKRR